jgi:predicted AAA+ superfamily ATPase
LLKQTSESLAGRVAQLGLTPFQAREVLAGDARASDMNTLWLRGGFPLSWLAQDDARSLLVAPVTQPFPMKDAVEVMSPLAAANLLSMQS